MSRISQDFINSVGYLYEEINIQQNDFLNEESQYYDEEASELVEDIIATISTSMVYEGYSAEGIIGFLADSSEESIIEKYLSFDENILTESNVSEDYIVEQLEIFDFAISENLLKLATKAGSFLGRVASKPARMKAAERLVKSNNPARTAAAYQKLANRNTAKAGFGVNSTGGAPASIRFKNTSDAARAAAMMKPVAKVKEIAKGAKAALPGIAKGALIGGTGVLAGYAGAKLGSGDGKVGPKLVGPKIVGPKIVGPKSSSPSGGGGGGGSSTPSSASPKPSPSKSAVTAQTGDKTKDMDTWAKANPKLAAAKAERDRTRGTSSTTNPLMADIKSKLPAASPASTSKPGPKEKKNQTPTSGPTPAIPDLKSVNADLKKANTPDALNKPAPANSALAKEQERRKREAEKAGKEAQARTVNASYEYDAYDLVLEYLLSQGHVETVEEANYVMLVMDAETIGSIVEEYENDLLAEEITEWVNELVDEGYDLSEYTWDDLAEYYVNEAKVDKYLDNKLKKSVGDDEIGRSMRRDIKISQRQKRRSVTYDTPRQRKLAQKLRDNRDADNDEGPLGYAARSQEK
jgi:hypothetical protein